MFVSADPVVKAVMILLVLASIATWTIALAKSIEVVRARRRLTRSLAVLERAETLADALGELERSETAGVFAQAAADELRLSADVTDAAGIKERIASHLARLEAAVGRRLVRGTGMLATIGATAPFVGLFGTVWGIMDSFISISKQQTTSLAVVAPGIAEALLATGMGLVAAIPAVVIYNLCARAITAHRASATDASAAVQRLAGRDLDRELSLRFDRRSVERSLKAAE